MSTAAVIFGVIAVASGVRLVLDIIEFQEIRKASV
ncbi:MAG: hypothetical protein Pg6C_09950 [Treponemataceae bacterium]|nr:MAG: hypothetical protein Pg6C_09950 [Treponemataceae bacterium]